MNSSPPSGEGDEPVIGRDGVTLSPCAPRFQRLRGHFHRQEFIEAAAAKEASELAPLLAPSAPRPQKIAQLQGECSDYVEVLKQLSAGQFHPGGIRETAAKDAAAPLLDRLQPENAHPTEVASALSRRQLLDPRSPAQRRLLHFLADRWKATPLRALVQSQQKHFFLPPDKRCRSSWLARGTGAPLSAPSSEEGQVSGATGKTARFR